MSALTYRFDGKLYRAQRERQGLSREELAVRLGCSYALVQAVELDRHIIKVDKAAGSPPRSAVALRTSSYPSTSRCRRENRRRLRCVGPAWRAHARVPCRHACGSGARPA